MPTSQQLKAHARWQRRQENKAAWAAMRAAETAEQQHRREEHRAEKARRRALNRAAHWAARGEECPEDPKNLMPQETIERLPGFTECREQATSDGTLVYGYTDNAGNTFGVEPLGYRVWLGDEEPVICWSPSEVNSTLLNASVALKSASDSLGSFAEGTWTPHGTDMRLIIDHVTPTKVAYHTVDARGFVTNHTTAIYRDGINPPTIKPGRKSYSKRYTPADFMPLETVSNCA